MRGVFVTGTDTGVGKTTVSAALMVRYRGARYWKPIQTGPDDDTAEVRRLAQCGRDDVYVHGVRLPDPVSPHLAAHRKGTRISLDIHTAWTKDSEDIWIVEGAGGALVPINESDRMVHLMERVGLPVVIAARSTLGTINHTLLTLEALRSRHLTVAGVVMVGPPDVDNRAAIEEFGKIAVIGEMPIFDPLTPAALGGWAAAHLDATGLLSEFLS